MQVLNFLLSLFLLFLSFPFRTGLRICFGHHCTRRTRILRIQYTLSSRKQHSDILDSSLAPHLRQRQADEDFINKSLLEQLDAEPIISSSDSSNSDHLLSSCSNPNSSPDSSPCCQLCLSSSLSDQIRRRTSLACIPSLTGQKVCAQWLPSFLFYCYSQCYSTFKASCDTLFDHAFDKPNNLP
ncbi:hypothetical protein BDP27DRAFT_297017 [Rhodocollybia butyracea]|uniref:Uncharacterized protein n=1 Tax=Rhodocollybia butyracea TaxID=206335 RepID=A0A9P5PAZ7_9AGAR|nr:hypothetical protein BDP27DRAFT_297017 [Rhodocollybia butyracea]